MKKKLLFVIDSLICGGAEKSLVSLLPLLNQEKYEIHLWMLHRGMVFESLLSKNVLVEAEPSYNIWEYFFFRLSHIVYSLLFRINKLLGIKEHTAETLWKCVGKAYKAPKETFDVAIAYQQGIPTYLVAEKVQAKMKIAWINADIFKAGYHPTFNASFYDQMDVLVSVSKQLERILLEHYPQYSTKLQCVYDIINPKLIKSMAAEPFAEQTMFSQNTTLVTVGRLAAAKNYLLAVETSKLLKEKDIPFKWYFVGEGEERPAIEKLIHKYHLQDEVILLGECVNPYPYMANCDVYVQTSVFEGYGLTIAEAKILGCPVVSTDFDVIYDQIVHGENGLIAKMTAESVADQIIRLLTDKELRMSVMEHVRSEDNTTYLTEIAKIERIIDAD